MSIYIKFIKIFIDYLFIKLLNKYVNFINLITFKEKVYIINIFILFNTLRLLETYLNLTY